jgi:solute carrier family 35 protein C2
MVSFAYARARQCGGSITLVVAGVVKEVLTVTVACLFGHESLTPINILGLLVSISGIIYYNVLKYR